MIKYESFFLDLEAVLSECEPLWLRLPLPGLTVLVQEGKADSLRWLFFFLMILVWIWSPFSSPLLLLDTAAIQRAMCVPSTHADLSKLRNLSTESGAPSSTVSHSPSWITVY